MRLVLLQSLILVAFIVFPLAMAEDPTEENVAAVQNTTFHNHSIYFEIPDGWEIYSDTEFGDNSSTILTDGMATIRIDTVKLSESELNQAAKCGFLGNTLDPDDGQIWIQILERAPWEFLGGLWKHYLPLTPPVYLKRKSGGSGLFSPDDAHAGYATNYNRKGAPSSEPLEWYLIWSKIEYGGRFIGVHTLFPANCADTYNMVNIARGGAPYDYYWPEPMYEMMSTFSTDWTGGPKDSIPLVSLV